LQDVFEARSLPAGPIASDAATAASAAGVPPAVVAAGPQSDDAAIRRLERQLEQLMNEVRALRAAKSGTPGPTAVPAAATTARQPGTANTPYSRGTGTSSAAAPRSRNPYAGTRSNRRNPYALGPADLPPAADAPSAAPPALATSVQTLTRVTYRLPEGKAQALARFLDEQAGDKIESKAVGQSLVVTASEADQQTVGRFVALIASAKAVPRTHFSGVTDS
jgi:hypothetical protein